jgi:hypothetical protein
MKAILIEEDRFAEICDLMKAEAINIGANSNTPERLGWDRDIWKNAVDEAHRSMHFHFVRWAQSHGARCAK